MRDIIIGAMGELANSRKAFHSEADFQFALSQVLASQHLNASIRLEKPYTRPNRINIDIFIRLERTRCALELKFHKASLQASDGEDQYAFPGTAPCDVPRYGFLKDMERIERIVRHGIVEQGFVLLLTNDPRLWDLEKSKQDGVDSNFALHRGRICQGHLSGHINGKPKDVCLENAYSHHWEKFSDIEGAGKTEFQYLLCGIPPVVVHNS